MDEVDSCRIKKRLNCDPLYLPADGFYEWKKVSGGKIPYTIQMKDGSVFAFAGLWEGWKPPNELVREIHTRMPVILREEYYDAWLSGKAGKEILKPFPADKMKVWSARQQSEE